MLVLLFVSCVADKQNERLTYDYMPNQPVIINVDVVPVGDVDVRFQHMLEEVNADYFNRDGIGINLVLKNRASTIRLNENGYFVVPTIIGKTIITVYVVKENLLKYDRRAFATGNMNIVLGESVQSNRTLAHEIGHIYGLQHINEANNVMNPLSIAWQYDVPNDFNKSQIEKMLNNIN